MIMNLAETQDWRVGLCCFETEGHDLLTQMLEKKHRTNFRNFAHEVGEDGLDFAWIGDRFVTTCEPFTEMSMDQILRNAQWVHDRTPLKGLLIDPYNYIANPTNNELTETDLVSVTLTKVKQFAERNSIHVWLVAHPAKRNKWVGGKRPQLYDIAGSAHFYNKCDMGLVLDRPDPGTEEVPPPEGLGALNIYVDKVRNRDAGQPGAAKLWFDRRSRCYAEAGRLSEEDRARVEEDRARSEEVEGRRQGESAESAELSKLSKLSVLDLQMECKQRGLRTGRSKKSELAQRIYDYDAIHA
jgi:twinkle protein